MTPTLVADDDPTLTPHTTARAPVRAKGAGSAKVDVARLAGGAALVIALAVGAWLARSWSAERDAPRTEALPVEAALGAQARSVVAPVHVDAGAAPTEVDAPAAFEASSAAIDAGAAVEAAGVRAADARVAADVRVAADAGGAAVKNAKARASKPPRPARRADEEDILHKRLEDLVKP